jgi:hypothetical protein
MRPSGMLRLKEFAMSNRRRAGNTTGGAIVLLLLVAGLGAWNYHRNLQIERESEGSRPYRSYASSDLEALRSAYAMELESVRAELAQTKQRRSQISRNQGSIAKNVEQFAQTAHTSSAIREAAGNVAERESQITELDKELELRSRFGQGMQRHLTLLLTI